MDTYSLLIFAGLALAGIGFTFLAIALLWTFYRIGSVNKIWERLTRLEGEHGKLDESFRAYVKRQAVRDTREKHGRGGADSFGAAPATIVDPDSESAWARRSLTVAEEIERAHAEGLRRR